MCICESRSLCKETLNSKTVFFLFYFVSHKAIMSRRELGRRHYSFQLLMDQFLL